MLKEISSPNYSSRSPFFHLIPSRDPRWAQIFSQLRALVKECNFYAWAWWGAWTHVAKWANFKKGTLYPATRLIDENAAHSLFPINLHLQFPHKPWCDGARGIMRMSGKIMSDITVPSPGWLNRVNSWLQYFLALTDFGSCRIYIFYILTTFSLLGTAG